MVTGGTVAVQCFNTCVYFRWRNESKLFDLSFNELMYDRRVAFAAFLFPTNRSAILLKNSLNFSGSTSVFLDLFLVDNLFDFVPNCSEFFP